MVTCPFNLHNRVYSNQSPYAVIIHIIFFSYFVQMSAECDLYKPKQNKNKF